MQQGGVRKKENRSVSHQVVAEGLLEIECWTRWTTESVFMPSCSVREDLRLLAAVCLTKGQPLPHDIVDYCDQSIVN